jgi:hypothetical protein
VVWSLKGIDEREKASRILVYKTLILIKGPWSEHFDGDGYAIKMKKAFQKIFVATEYGKLETSTSPRLEKFFWLWVCYN